LKALEYRQDDEVLKFERDLIESDELRRTEKKNSRKRTNAYIAQNKNKEYWEENGWAASDRILDSLNLLEPTLLIGGLKKFERL
jgi:hypothetical protein